MPDAFDDDLQTPSADAADTIRSYSNGFAIRQCEGPRPSLVWQAGVLVTEVRNYQDGGMLYPFRGTVSLFHLLGHGATRDEAIEMAQKNENANGVNRQ